MATSLENCQYAKELAQTAAKIASAGKGILAADESTGTIGKRLAAINMENNEDNRRTYRELLFTSPKEWADYISGVILYEETFYQKHADGKSFIKTLQELDVVPGIKLDRGVKPIPGTDGETDTYGLDDLAVRAAKFYADGARFTKWRNVMRINISKQQPTERSVKQNAATLAKYAAICQANGLVPIVEPEILMDGPHTIQDCARVTEHVLAEVYKALHDHGVYLEGTLLKPNMVLPGKECEKQATAVECAAYTLKVLRRTVPAAVPGIHFLSGGQSEEEATLNLDAMNRAPGVTPWHVSFSYGRALQHSCIRAWDGKPENVAKAQATLIARAKANSEATKGAYEGGAAAGNADESLYQKDYVY